MYFPEVKSLGERARNRCHLTGPCAEISFQCTWRIQCTWPINLLVNKIFMLHLVLWKCSKTTGSTFQRGGDSLPFTHSCFAWDPGIAKYFGWSQNLQPSIATVTLITKPGLAHNPCYHVPNLFLFLFFFPLYFHILIFQELSPVSWGDPNTKSSNGYLHSCSSAEVSRSRYPIIQKTQLDWELRR